jgi:hypothetical protein
MVLIYEWNLFYSSHAFEISRINHISSFALNKMIYIIFGVTEDKKTEDTVGSANLSEFFSAPCRTLPYR